MKIAITGGSGFLGGYVVEKLKSEKYNPIIFTRKKIFEIENGCEYRVTDYSKQDLVEKLADIDAVVHLAAKRGSQGKISEFHDNEILTQNLYEACYERSILNIVFASTISVYSDQNTLPWTEKDLPASKLMYGVSKLVNEYIGNIYSEKGGLFIKNLRLAHIFGFNEKNNYMINRFMRQAFHRETLVVRGKSMAKREFLYAKDAAKAIVNALQKHDLSGTFNIGSGEAFTNLEVAEIINRVFDNKGNICLQDPEGDEGIESSYMDSSKSKEILEFSPSYTFESALKEIYVLMRRLDNVPLWY